VRDHFFLSLGAAFSVRAAFSLGASFLGAAALGLLYFSAFLVASASFFLIEAFCSDFSALIALTSIGSLTSPKSLFLRATLLSF